MFNVYISFIPCILVFIILNNNLNSKGSKNNFKKCCRFFPIKEFQITMENFYDFIARSFIFWGFQQLFNLINFKNYHIFMTALLINNYTTNKYNIWTNIVYLLFFNFISIHIFNQLNIMVENFFSSLLIYEGGLLIYSLSKLVQKFKSILSFTWILKS